ncbi:hypothetical protein LY76DRAFT_594130 [Colletotrichum caudatum]|nr:hypothetical protein LY76DRAFT_594130 [Colletotrichum caudatum]
MCGRLTGTLRAAARLRQPVRRLQRTRTIRVRPTEFIPELHSEDPVWKANKRDVREPFSYGPRNCIRNE